eukprot:COSAG02_NODE_566_length_20219_cov_13.531759_11_plen_100_part_00
MALQGMRPGWDAAAAAALASRLVGGVGLPAVLTGPDPAGFRGGEVEFQVSEFFEPMGMSRRILPWAPVHVAISVETYQYQSRPIPGRAVSHCSIQRCLR